MRLRTRAEGSTAGAVVPYERKAIARLEGQSGVVHGLDGHDIAVVRLDASVDTTENVVAERPVAGIVDRDFHCGIGECDGPMSILTANRRPAPDSARTTAKRSQTE